MVLRVLCGEWKTTGTNGYFIFPRTKDAMVFF